MDVRVEANSMEAGTTVPSPKIINIIAINFPHSAPAISLTLTPTIPSVGGHSISAITPDNQFLLGGLATA